MTPNSNRIPPLQHQQRPIQPRLTVSFPLDKLPPKRRQAGAPANGQPPPQLLLQFCDFLIELLAPLILALVDCVHRTGQEEPDCLIDMLCGGDGGQGELRKGFGDADDGLELADCDGD